MKKIFLLIFIFTICLPVFGQEKKSTLTVTLKGLKVEGTVYISLYNNEKGFPIDSDKAYAKNMKKVKSAVETIVFKDLPLGTYAVSVWHDQNDNQKMEKNFIGIPKEGLGVSNDAKGKMGPPKFKDAKFDINSESHKISININY